MHPQKRGKIATSLVVVPPGHVITLASEIGKLLLLLWTIGNGVDEPPRGEGSQNQPGDLTFG